MTVPRAVALIEELARVAAAGVMIGAGTVLDAGHGAAGDRRRRALRRQPGVPAAASSRVCHARDVPVDAGLFHAHRDSRRVGRRGRPREGVSRDVARSRLHQGHARPAAAGSPGADRRRHARNAGDWIRAGAVAIGVGTALVDRTAVDERRFDAITANARHFVERCPARARRATVGACDGRRPSASAKSCCG